MNRQASFAVFSVGAIAVLVQTCRSQQPCPLPLANWLSFRLEAKQNASATFTGTFRKPHTNAADGEVTDFHVEEVLRGRGALGERKVIQVPRTIKEIKDPPRYLVLCDATGKELDLYRFIPLQRRESLVYYRQALVLDDRNPVANLKFFFKHLEDPDPEVAKDANHEFARTPYVVLKTVFRELPTNQVIQRLQNPKVSPDRLGLYALMLGHCGTKDHTHLLRSMLNNNELRRFGRCDSILAAYVMLSPKEGWHCVGSIMNEPAHEFLYRYSALRASRLLSEYRPDLVRHKELAESVAPLLTQKDIADLAIEDLRKLKCWDMTDRILALQADPVYSTRCVQRSILRFALSNKNNPAAAQYVAEQRKKDAVRVQDTEELLKLDDDSEAPAVK